MKNKLLQIGLISLTISACGQFPQPESVATVQDSEPRSIEPEGMTIGERIAVPVGYERVRVHVHSFASYLRNLPLKPAGSAVHLYNGELKSRQDVHAAVVDMDTGGKDLQQCADAVMRLRAEYLLAEKRYNDIHFDFTNGFTAEYAKWREGGRISITGNHCQWRQTGRASGSYADFRKYMDLVFSYAGTLSLAKELKPVDIEELKAGDVFIQGGSPGHAIIVVDVARHTKTNDKIFLLAQSYMPAQEIHILKNPESQALSPWYSAAFGEILRTPEWTFKKADLKRF
ncbi:MAG: DUF4846 domain-containing protein [Saprospiraceae bacterium]